MSHRRSVIWVDTSGATRETIINTTLSAGAAIQASLAALSNAGVSLEWDGTLNVVGGAPSALPYAGVADAARLLYGDAFGGETLLTLPAPKAGIFLADGQTVDPAAIAALNLLVIGDLITGGGSPVTTYLGGVRRRNRTDFP